MTAHPVKITSAHKYYNRGKSNQIHVMDDISLELPAQGMVAVFGRSGCGKTTLLNAVGGLDRIASGSIEIFGQNIKENTDTLRNRYVGYIFQNYNLSVTDTVYENVASALRLCGMEDEQEIGARVMAALGNVDMARFRDRTPDTLSGGQQQRVAIARAIVKAPAILLCDEPTGNLDEANTVMVMDILKELSRTCLVMLVTHEAHLVDYYCDRVIEIVDGRVHSDRVNEGAKGYVQRNKNHIYLGELSHTETATPGVTVEYYGEPAEEIKLKVISHDGKLYLKAEHPGVKILDEGSEIRLMEGVFEEAPKDPAAIHGHPLDMSLLTPVEGKHYGRLYHWKNALASAWRENFSKKKKRGKGLLRACLVLLAMALVFMTAAFGAGLGYYAELRKNHNENAFYVPVKPDADYPFIREDMGQHGMDFSRIIGGSPLYDFDYLSFNSAAFMTADHIAISCQAQAQDAVNAKALTVVAGTAEMRTQSDVLITTAVADELLENATVSYLDTYEDLVGMISNNTYYTMGNIRLRIAGVLESDEKYYYLDSLLFANHVMREHFGLPITYASAVGMEEQLQPGQAVYVDEGATSVDNSVGAQLKIMGLPLTVSRVIKRHYSLEEYPAYVKETYGETLTTDPGIYTATMLPEGTDGDVGYWSWLFDHYFRYLPEFLASKLATLRPYDDVPLEEWAVAMKRHIGAYATLMNVDQISACGAFLYGQEKGSYPTQAELKAFMGSDGNRARIEELASYDRLYKEYDRYLEQHWNGSAKEDYYYVLSDEDYVRLITGAGIFENVLLHSPYGIWEYDEIYYTNHIMIRSSDPEATEAYLAEKLGEDGFIRPDNVFDQLYADVRGAVIITVSCVAAVIALMCLCVFFIMRSSFMSRIREVGILRAIGVTKKNLIFRFAVETALLLLLTTVPGYLLSAWFVGSLAGAPFISEIFYFPLWLGVSLFVLLLAVSLLCGVLPAHTLLRKTPSEILSKYDI